MRFSLLTPLAGTRLLFAALVLSFAPSGMAQSSPAQSALSNPSQDKPHLPIVPAPSEQRSASQQISKSATPSTASQNPPRGVDAAAAASTSSASAPSQISASNSLTVTLTSSTSHIIQGAAYGLDVTFKNSSSSPIAVPLTTVYLSVQPELGPADAMCAYPFTVTQITTPWVLLLPGDSYTAAIDPGSHVGHFEDSNPCKATRLDRIRKKVDFVPGNYAFVISGTYCQAKIELSSSAGYACLIYHSFTNTTSLPLTIDQAQIVLFAAIGGFFAWLVMKVREGNPTTTAEVAAPPGGVAIAAVIAPPIPPPADPATPPVPRSTAEKRIDRWVMLRSIGKGAREIAGAALMSVTITVVAGRLSTAQFPIKVSVDDFWGALTVGFVSYFIGGKFIDKLSKSTA